MKLRYIATLMLAATVASCNILEKEPADSWESSSAIASYTDLVNAVNGVYESQTWTANTVTSSRGIYAGDFTLYADLRGPIICVSEKTTSLPMFPNTWHLPPARHRKLSISLLPVAGTNQQGAGTDTGSRTDGRGCGSTVGRIVCSACLVPLRPGTLVRQTADYCDRPEYGNGYRTGQTEFSCRLCRSACLTGRYL